MSESLPAGVLVLVVALLLVLVATGLWLGNRKPG